MLTIEPPLAVLIMAGIACLESKNIVSTLTRITRRYSSGFSSTTLPRLPMPTLLSRKSSRPQRSTAASTSRLHSASTVTSQANAAALPPWASIISTVRPASPGSRSATTTLAPARASKIAAARPLPTPSPAAPPPLTIATLPAKPSPSRSRMRASVNCLSTVSADKKCFETETLVDATAQVTVGRRNIESWVFVQEASRVKRKTGRDHRLDREILGAGNMVQAKAVPDHDILIDQRPIRGSPGWQSVSASALVGITAGCVNLVGMIGRNPQLSHHEGRPLGHHGLRV